MTNNNTDVAKLVADLRKVLSYMETEKSYGLLQTNARVAKKLFEAIDLHLTKGWQQLPPEWDHSRPKPSVFDSVRDTRGHVVTFKPLSTSSGAWTNCTCGWSGVFYEPNWKKRAEDAADEHLDFAKQGLLEPVPGWSPHDGQPTVDAPEDTEPVREKKRMRKRRKPAAEEDTPEPEVQEQEDTGSDFPLDRIPTELLRELSTTWDVVGELDPYTEHSTKQDRSIVHKVLVYRHQQDVRFLAICSCNWMWASSTLEPALSAGGNHLLNLRRVQNPDAEYDLGYEHEHEPAHEFKRFNVMDYGTVHLHTGAKVNVSPGWRTFDPNVFRTTTTGD
jgi:hypothetical protein